MNNSPNTHTEALSTTTPYRHTELQSTCCLCKGTGSVTCCRCGATFCLTHGAVGELCADCSLELAYRRNRVAKRGSLIIGLPGAALVAGMAPVLPLNLTMALCVTVFFLGMLALGVAVHASRIRFLAEGHGKSKVALGSLAIAPRSAEDSSPRRRSAYGHRGRGEPPQVPMWQRTYGVG